jgi:hypothetical protein
MESTFENMTTLKAQTILERSTEMFSNRGIKNFLTSNN